MIIKKIIFITFSFFLLWSKAESHSGKANIHVVIDTDCGADDLRAISLLLASPEINVHAVITSDGALSPSEGLNKVKGLLSSYHHEGIPVAEGYSHLTSPPAFREICQKIDWGDNSSYINSTDKKPDELLEEIIEREKVSLVYISLGSLYNVWEIIRQNAALKSYIKEIVWYNGKNNTNYNFSKIAADSILNSSLNIKIISSNNFEFTNDLYQQINSINSDYTNKITGTVDFIKKSHKKIMIWDDFVSLYILHPKSFEKQADNKYYYIDSKTNFIKDYIKILDIETYNESKVFSGFPTDTFLFAKDVQIYIEEIIKNNGLSEWRAGVLTNELHGHLGIYAIIGTKMGMRAREYYNTGIDDIITISFAGSNPPVSCMNDGIQVSTGATLGHGLISVADNEKKRPVAQFSFRGQTIEISLKNEYWDQIKRDVIHCIQQYGLGSDEYWLHIRKLAIQYWKDWHRHVIFDIKNVD